MGDHAGRSVGQSTPIECDIEGSNIHPMVFQRTLVGAWLARRRCRESAHTGSSGTCDRNSSLRVRTTLLCHLRICPVDIRLPHRKRSSGLRRCEPPRSCHSSAGRDTSGPHSIALHSSLAKRNQDDEPRTRQNTRPVTHTDGWRAVTRVAPRSCHLPTSIRDTTPCSAASVSVAVAPRRIFPGGSKRVWRPSARRRILPAGRRSREVASAVECDFLVSWLGPWPSATHRACMSVAS